MSPARGGSVSARAERWSESGLLDVDFYAALRGRRFDSPIETAEDFVGHGMAQRLSPHPFLDVLSLPADVRRAFRRGKVNPVLRHLTGPDGSVRPVGPLAAPRDPEQLRAHLLAVAGRIGGQRAPQAAPAPQARVTGRTSVVVMSDGSASPVRSAASAVRHAGDLDVEVVVVDHGFPPHVVLGLHAWACAHFSATPTADGAGWLWTAGAVRLVLRDVDEDADEALCTGDRVVRLDASCEVRRGWLPSLLAPLDDPDVEAVQPLLLQPDDSIAAAGLSDTGAPLLVDHPREDALRLEGVAVPGISHLAVARRAGDAGVTPRSADGLRVAPTSWVSTSSTAVGSGLRDGREGRVESTSWVSTSSTAVGSGSRAGTSVAADIRSRVDGRLRWSIKLASPPGGYGDTWGDTHYADAVAAALRRLGQDVVTRRRGAHESGPVHLDDVSLALRGLHPMPPTPGQRNVLWVISHPEDVDPGEFEGYDVVCAASTVWSREMSERTGREVVPLLQASEFQWPAGTPATWGQESTVVFVGTNLGKRERPVVWQAVEAGVPLSVYGPGWEGLPAGVWQDEYVSNARLPELYRHHGIVLADHWPDMAERGFIANRVFDAVASGARVISNDVVGLHDVFDPHDVMVARTPEEMRDAVAAVRASSGPPRVEGASWSFDDRAATLLEAVGDRQGRAR